MLKPLHFLCLPALILPSAVLAAPVQLPCKIPARGDWQMTNERHGWSGDGKPWTVIATQSIHVEREADGIRLTIGIVRAKSDLEGAAGKRLLAAFGPNVQQPITLWLAEDGRIKTVDDLDRHWKANLDLVEQIARDMEAAGQSGARARATLAALGQADEQTRIEMVAANVGPFLHHCGQQVEGDMRDKDVADRLVVVRDDVDGPQLSESTTYRIDGATGLARDIARRVTVKAQPARPQIDHWRFDPMPVPAVN